MPKDENMIKLGFQKKLLLTAMTLVFVSAGAANADDLFEFDDSILRSMGFDNVDLSAFSGSGDHFLGEYIAEITLNGNKILEEHPIHFYQDDGENIACITEGMAEGLNLRHVYIKLLKEESEFKTDVGACLNITSLDRSVLVNFDASQQVLAVIMPQAYLEDRDYSWVRPESRDNGIAGVILDYSLIWNYDRMRTNYGGSHYSNSDFRSYGTVGGNLGRFRLRADYQYYSKSSDGSRKFNWNQIYGFTDIPSWNAKIFVGEISTRSNVFDTTRIKGVSLYSDENMMPSYLRGYAPQITGIASSNAIVTIRQYGGVIKTEQVSAGPFVISDLPSYLTGVVSVEIEEANGETRSYQIDVAQVPFLTRKGHFRYSANIGRIDPLYGGEYKVGTELISADLSYGLMNNVSIYGGIQHTTNNEYKAYNLGVGLNLGKFGAFSMDVTKSASNSNLSQEDDRSGTSYRFNYAKRFTSSTTINIAGYRFSSRGFTSLNNYIEMKQAGHSDAAIFEKNRFSLSITQYIPNIDLSVTGTVSKSSYWNTHNMSNYAISFSKNIRKEGFFKNSNINLTLSQDSGDFYEDKNRRIGFYINIPLESDNSGRLQYGGRYNTTDRKVDQNLTYYASGLGGNYSVGTRVYHKKDLSGSVDYSLDASYDAETGYGQFNASVDYEENRQNMRAGFEGSLTLTQHGIATHSRAYSPMSSRLILDAGATGVPMANNAEDVSNIFGLIGVSNISSYSYGSYQIDNDKLPDNVEITGGIVDVAVSDGAIAYRSLGGISGEKAISTISLINGEHPPFGATVYRENGEDREVAIIADQGLTYLTGLKKNARFVVKWGAAHECELQIESLKTEDLQNLICY